MYKQDLVLNNLQWLICRKTQPSNKILKCNTFTIQIRGSFSYYLISFRKHLHF